MQLSAVFQWIETLPFVRIIVIVPGLYPAISALHILGIALLVGCIATVDLRLLGIFRGKLDEALPGLVQVALGGFSIAATTGLLLASVRIGHYAFNPAFLTKMAILLIAGTNALVLRLGAGSADVRDRPGKFYGRLAAGLSLALWAGAVFSGRWIAFV